MDSFILKGWGCLMDMSKYTDRENSEDLAKYKLTDENSEDFSKNKMTVTVYRELRRFNQIFCNFVTLLSILYSFTYFYPKSTMICIHLRMGWYFEGVKFRRSVRI